MPGAIAYLLRVEGEFETSAARIAAAKLWPRSRTATLVLIRRAPLMARSVIALDQLSGGRFDLGVGAGRFADQAIAGVLDMSAGERITRLEEGLVDLSVVVRPVA